MGYYYITPIMFRDPFGTCKTHGCYYMPTCYECNPSYKTFIDERGKDWAEPDSIYQQVKNNIGISYNDGSSTNGHADIQVEIHANWSDPTITIIDSYKILDSKMQRAILHYTMNSQYYDANVFTRSIESYRIEWDAHTLILQGGWWLGLGEQAKDADLNNNENLMAYYYVICVIAPVPLFLWSPYTEG